MLESNHKLSIAIPLYNEEEVLPELLRRVRKVMDELPGGPHELICVDDGSSDRTYELVAEAAHEDSRVVLVSFSRNFGHQAAFSAALDHSTGDVVALMDGDLQDPPEELPKMLAKLAEGFDVVHAVRLKRKEGLLLRACYWLFYVLISKLAAIQLPRDSGDFCVMTRRVVKEITCTPERHRYLRGLRAWVGFKQTGVAVERQERFAGKSKYSWSALFRLAFDGIFSFSVVPLRAATVMGGFAILFSMLFAVYSLYVRIILNESPPGFTALILALSFFAGAQLIFLGIIGEYVGRIFEQVKGRPVYVVRDILNEPTKWTNPTHGSTKTFSEATGGGKQEISSSEESSRNS